MLKIKILCKNTEDDIFIIFGIEVFDIGLAFGFTNGKYKSITTIGLISYLSTKGE